MYPCNLLFQRFRDQLMLFNDGQVLESLAGDSDGIE